MGTGGVDVSGWEVDDRSLRDVAETPIVDLLARAHNGDLAALNEVWRTFVRPVVLRKSGVVCSWVSHRGERCSGETCDEAFGSAVQAGARRILGVRNDLRAAPERELAFRLLDAQDVESMTAGKGRSQLRYWNEFIGPEGHLRDTWPKLINSGLERGRFLVEVRRQWNSTRGLVHRIDQIKYLDKRSATVPGRSFIDVFSDLWTGVVVPGLESTGNSEMLGTLARLQMLSPDSTVVRSLLGPVYDDACDNDYEDLGLDAARVARHLTHINVRNGRWSVDDAPTEQHIARFFAIFENCLELTYQQMGIDDPAARHLVFHLARARETSRKLPRPVGRNDESSLARSSASPYLSSDDVDLVADDDEEDEP